MGPSMRDEIDCGNFFDHIDDLVEFPPDQDCGNLLIGSGGCNDFPSIWDEALPEGCPLFSGSNRNSVSDLSAELSVPYEDVVQLEWLSKFVEDSFSGRGMTLAKDYSSAQKETSRHQFHTLIPVSVLESSSSSSSGSTSSSSIAGVKSITANPIHRGPQRARSKRPRPATLNTRPVVKFKTPSCSFGDTNSLFDTPGSPKSRNFVESEHHAKKFHKPHAMEQKKKNKIKMKAPSSPTEVHQNITAQAVRKCRHCEITKTPQWRAGPMGPKTLCNACGVRYKSGKLFPEYRPAASPTFVPSLHSNSHKKVLQMRSKIVEKNPAPQPAVDAATASKRDLVVNNKPVIE